MNKPIVAVVIGQAHYPRMFSPQAWESLAAFAEVIHHEGEEPATKEELLALLPQASGIITSWGVAQLDADVMAAAPNLVAMAHMGSSVKRFVSDAFWERGMHLTSSGIILARDVAETTLGLMLVGMKRIWPLGQHVRDGGWRDAPVWERWISRELVRKNVGIIGASNVGRHVIELLGPFEVNILLYDPFVTAAEAAQTGYDESGIGDDLLREADVVSLHAPSNAKTLSYAQRGGIGADEG
jgi:phosphoglycerate dehydrogenase-like enzyme